ncbi:hypothetical protein ACFC1B_30100, partial [Streptomyces xiamenensis]|uniref:hypothetical protein n=1 Tax=Streptomyces xiamenensis TaxID=408015 RepID=UPI0035E295EB
MAVEHQLLVSAISSMLSTGWQDAEDFAQEVYVRVLEGAPATGLDDLIAIAEQVIAAPSEAAVPQQLTPAPYQPSGLHYHLPTNEDPFQNMVIVTPLGHWWHHLDGRNWLNNPQCRGCAASGRTPHNVDQAGHM